MRMKAVTVIIIFTAGFLFSENQDQQPLKPGTPAPVFSLPSLEGERVALRVWCGDRLIKPYLNKVPHTVILSFWATYCEPCKKEIPELMKFYKKHENENVRIFLISLDKEGASVVKPFVEKNKYTLPVLLDPYKRTSARYGINSLPSMVIIGPDQIIRYSTSGYTDAESFARNLEDVYTKVKRGRNTEAEIKGETVSVKEEMPQEKPQKKQITPKQKWTAVMKLENGETLEKIAEKLSVQPSDISAWREELKEAAIDIWTQ